MAIPQKRIWYKQIDEEGRELAVCCYDDGSAFLVLQNQHGHKNTFAFKPQDIMCLREFLVHNVQRGYPV